MKALTKCLLALFFVVPYSCCLLAEATACGTYATFSPDPIYAFRDSLTVTFTAPLSDVKIHGNNDGSCDDAYSLDASNVASITISREDQLTRFSASSSFHLCQGVTHLCSISRTFFALNPRNGEYKMLTFAPASIFSHIAGAQVNHAVTISNPSGSVFSARLSGYTFDYGLSLSRTCATVPAPALDSTNSYFGPNIFVLLGTTVSGNTYSLCQRVNDASTAVVADWHPLSGVYGNWEANIQADVPASSGSWTVQEATPGDGVVQYGESIVVEIPRQWYTNGVRYFGIDTGSDVCSPYLTNTFAHTDLAVVNATHHRVTTTLSRPYGQPGGGRGVICGSTGVGTPWSLLTSEMTSGAITYCAANGGVLPADLTTCLYCAATSSDPPCYDHGDCTLDQEDKSYLLRKAPECSCDDGFYGNFCQYARLDKPVFWPENGTYVSRYTIDIFINASNDDEDLTVTINSDPPVNCSNPCTLVLSSPDNYTISAYAFHSNGSRSDVEYAEYEVILPTDTRTETETLASTSTESFSDQTTSWSTSRNTLSQASPTDGSMSPTQTQNTFSQRTATLNTRSVSHRSQSPSPPSKSSTPSALTYSRSESLASPSHETYSISSSASPSIPTPSQPSISGRTRSHSMRTDSLSEESVSQSLPSSSPTLPPTISDSVLSKTQTKPTYSGKSSSMTQRTPSGQTITRSWGSVTTSETVAQFSPTHVESPSETSTDNTLTRASTETLNDATMTQLASTSTSKGTLTTTLRQHTSTGSTTESRPDDYGTTVTPKTTATDLVVEYSTRSSSYHLQPSTSPTTPLPEGGEDSISFCSVESNSTAVTLTEAQSWVQLAGNFSLPCADPNNCTASCSAGLAMDCSTLNITLKYVAPEDDHFCTAVVGNTSYRWQVYVRPRVPLRYHLSVSQGMPTSAFLRPSYSAAPVPYHQRGMTWGLHPCGLDDSLVPKKVPVRSGIRVQSDCFNVSITGAGFIESFAQFTETRPRVAQKRAAPIGRGAEAFLSADALMSSSKVESPRSTSPMVKVLGLVVLAESLFLLALVADRRWRR